LSGYVVVVVRQIHDPVVALHRSVAVAVVDAVVVVMKLVAILIVMAHHRQLDRKRRPFPQTRRRRADRPAVQSHYPHRDEQPEPAHTHPVARLQLLRIELHVFSKEHLDLVGSHPHPTVRHGDHQRASLFARQRGGGAVSRVAIGSVCGGW
jgi:hypothetical protein